MFVNVLKAESTGNQSKPGVPRFPCKKMWHHYERFVLLQTVMSMGKERLS